ncbi:MULTISPECIES: hypothetical protein [Bacillus]|uniref:hypothetical protein n=1 Tax=Bacillus TaxID=1386 RepID=UPI0006170317|nr:MULTISPECIES: hypothetical protein [Bacillus]HWO74425.1 hypothetical protein [Bacillus sp. (in: firmicutes)]KKB71984.1 hypothetical protein TH62_20520 [Bacillus sp. TH008]MDU0072089.1 hypothetical protein [Bacillus sp. IG6]MED8019652.1 hypothetical protein [Bacillus glycinifermentans]WKB79224.1 hypothetical protein QYM22_10405 [Bacillus glycinifermentans]
MRHLDLKTIEEILRGKISTNPKRFECANGIVFSLNNRSGNALDYLSSRGIEIHELVKGIYYTETVMTVIEFEGLDCISHVIQIA